MEEVVKSCSMTLSIVKQNQVKFIISGGTKKNVLRFKVDVDPKITITHNMDCV